MIITAEHVKEVIFQEPELTYEGFYSLIHHKRSKRTETDYVEKLRSSQADLFKHLDEIQICYDWLQEQVIGATVNERSYSSYGLKHAIEWASHQATGSTRIYVSNGAFLAAVVISKVPFARDDSSSLNAAVAVRHDKRNKKLWNPLKADSGYCEFKPFPVGYFVTEGAL